MEISNLASVSPSRTLQTLFESDLPADGRVREDEFIPHSALIILQSSKETIAAIAATEGNSAAWNDE